MTRLFQTQIQIGNLPLVLTMISNGSVAINQLNTFRPMIDNGPDGLQANFWSDGFTIIESGEGEEYFYNKAVKLEDHPALKRWLQKQELPNPFVEGYEQY